jgi:hypothetical protein
MKRNKVKNYKKRLIYFIDPKFQVRVLLYSSFFSVTLLLIIYFFHNYYFSHLINVGKSLNLETGHPYYKILAEQRSVFLNYFYGMSGIIIVFTLAVSTLFSHKIAGPIYRIKKYFIEGEPDNGQKASIREGDFFQELPNAINEYFGNKR